ncbi:MAG: RNA polymerase sigma factor [Acidimicrobiales bacterium]
MALMPGPGPVGLPRLRSIRPPRGAPRGLEELAEAARGGDGDAFADLVRLTYADTYALAYRLTGDADDACDVLQEAYLKAFRSIKGFRGEAGFATWMYRVTANCASTHLSRRHRRRHDPLDLVEVWPDETPGSDPAAMAAAADDRLRLIEALAGLSGPVRAVVVLRDIYDWPHEQVAAELGITVATAKVRAHRGRKKLRELLFPMPAELYGAQVP